MRCKFMNLDYYKKIKKEKKLTIAQIAAAANLPKGTVQNIFCGYIPNPRIDTIYAIEKALGLEKANTNTLDFQNNTITVERLEALGFDLEKLNNLSDTEINVIIATISNLAESHKKDKK